MSDKEFKLEDFDDLMPSLLGQHNKKMQRFYEESAAIAVESVKRYCEKKGISEEEFFKGLDKQLPETNQSK